MQGSIMGRSRLLFVLPFHVYWAYAMALLLLSTHCFVQSATPSLRSHESGSEFLEYNLTNPHDHGLQEGTWTNITYDDFEGGWGSFAKKYPFSDATLLNYYKERQYFHQGITAVRIRDNSGVNSSVYHKHNHDVTAYTALRVQFWFCPRSMEGREDFFLEYSANGGSTWTILKQYVHGQEFQNGGFYFDSVEWNGTTYDLTDQAKIRFRCDASGDGDYIYIDEILFQGFLAAVASSEPTAFHSLEPSSSPSAGALLTRDDICPLDRLDPPEKYQILPYADTTSGDGVQDDLSEISYLAFSDQKGPSGYPYAYVASDKEQFSVKVLEITNDVFAGHFDGIGNVVATYTLNVTYDNDDWEDISLGPCTDSNDAAYTIDQTCIYIGNFGNNPRSQYTQRDVLKVFKFVEPLIDIPQDLTNVDVATIEYRYDAYSGFSDSKIDAESMFVDWRGVDDSMTENKGDIYIITKTLSNRCNDRVGKIPVSAHKNLAPGEVSVAYNLSAVLDRLPNQGQGVNCSNSAYRVWNGADMRRDGHLIALIRGGPPASVFFFPRLPNQSVADALSGFPCPFVSSTSYGLPNEKKHEAVAFVDAEGSRVTDTSECQQGASCNVNLYSYELIYPSADNVPIVEPIGGWMEIAGSSFEDGWGSFLSGGKNAIRSNASGCSRGNCACSGSFAVELRHGEGAASSFHDRDDRSCDAFSLLRITFQFQFRGYDHFDAFFAELSLDGGVNYFIVGNWAKGINGVYRNGICYDGHVLLSPTMIRVPSFGTQVRLRFRNSANSNNDRVYVDSVQLEGHFGM